MVPETRYARVGDRQVAYQVIGEGPIDLLVPSLGYLPIDLMWDQPSLVHFINRLATFGRSIWCDAWGIGASDRLWREEARLLESSIDDMVAVLDAACSRRAAVLDFVGGRAAQLFAASHPERTRALVLDSPTARLR